MARVWVVETKDGVPVFAEVKLSVCLDFYALLNPKRRKECKPQPVPYERSGQQEMFDVCRMRES